MPPRPVFRALALACAALAVIGEASAGEPALAGAWQTDGQVKARLVADAGAREDGKRLAGIEIVLGEAWKTYWRMPGTSGVPPSFDWSGSANADPIEVRYPAPHRFVDKDDETVGYKGTVVWPVLVGRKAPGEAVRLKLGLEIGVCKDVCVPVQLALALDLPAAAGTSVAGYVAPWLDRVPRPLEQRRPTDPAIESIEAHLKDARPHIRIVARYGERVHDADLFPEAPDGLYVPLPKMLAHADGRRMMFDIDLSRDVELKELVGRTLRFTVVGGGGAVETSWKLE